MSGYIKLHRAIEHHWLWLDPRRLQWWIQLLFMAAWEPKRISFGNTNINLQRGQIATTTRMLMKKFMCCNQTVFNFLAVLENDNMIVRKTNQKMTLITIVNYERYQQDYQIPANVDDSLKSIQPHRNPNRKIERIKEDNNEEEKKLIFNSTTTREDNFNFFEEIKSDENFWQDAIKGIFGNPDNRDECLKWLREKAESFWGERCSKRDFRSTRDKLQEYLFNWLRSAYEKELGRADKKNSIANEYENKYAARRGTDAGSHSEKDYGGSF